MNEVEKDPWSFPRGTRAVVTEGCTQIGAAVVEELSKKGAKVLTCSSNEDELQDMVKDWKKRGLKVEGVPADLTTVIGRHSFTNVVRIWLRGRTLDVLINNFHPAEPSNPDQNSNEEQTNRVVSEFHASSMLTSICYEQLKRFPGNGKSSVVNILKIPSLRNPIETGEAAAIQSTGEWAYQWGRDGIRVNCVVPWLIKTESKESSSEAIEDQDYQEASAKHSPMGELGEPRDVAGLVTFLALPISNFITNQVMHIDGGYSCSSQPRESNVFPAKAEDNSNLDDSIPLNECPSSDIAVLKESPSSEHEVVSLEQISTISDDNINNNEISLATPSLEDFCRELEEGESVAKESQAKPVNTVASTASEESLTIRQKLSTDVRWEAWKNRQRTTANDEQNQQEDQQEAAVSRPETDGTSESLQHNVCQRVSEAHSSPCLQSSLKSRTVPDQETRDEENVQSTRDTEKVPRQMYENIQSVSFQDGRSCNKIQSVSFQESRSLAESRARNMSLSRNGRIGAEQRHSVENGKMNKKDKAMFDVNRLTEIRDKVRRLKKKRRDSGLPPHPPQKNNSLQKSLRCVFPTTKEKSYYFDTEQDDNDFILCDGSTALEI